MSEPIGWHLLHQAHVDRQSVMVCATAACVADNGLAPADRGPGDWVGYVVEINGSHDGTVTLGGIAFGFRTEIRWADICGAWLRDEAPNPCLCGTFYSEEPERPIPLPSTASHEGRTQ